MTIRFQLAVAALVTASFQASADLRAAGTASEGSAYLFTSFRLPARDGLRFLFSFDG